MGERDRRARRGRRRAVTNAARAVAAPGEADRLVDGLVARLAPRPDEDLRRLAEIGDVALPVRRAAERVPAGAVDHAVTFWRGERAPAGVVGFLLGPVDAGAPVVVVATAAHRRAILAGLAAAGADVPDARRSGALVCLDADEVLDALLLDGRIDPGRFDEVIGSVVRRAGLGGRLVTAYGEVVALLWDLGDVAGAVALEGCWNDLARSGPELALLCSYPASALREGADGEAVRAVCRTHASLVLATGDGAGSPPPG